MCTEIFVKNTLDNIMRLASFSSDRIAREEYADIVTLRIATFTEIRRPMARRTYRNPSVAHSAQSRVSYGTTCQHFIWPTRLL